MCPTMSVSLLRHNSNHDRYSQGKLRLKRCVFIRLRKTDSDMADVRCCARLFQTRAAVTGKAQLPIVDSRVRWTVSNDDEVECRRQIKMLLFKASFNIDQT